MNNSRLQAWARIALGSAAIAFLQLPAVKAATSSATELPVPRLQATGTLLTIANPKAGTISVTPVGRGVQKSLSNAQAFDLSPELPYILSADGLFLAGMQQNSVDGTLKLLVFNTLTGVRIGSVGLATRDTPDGIWINSAGTAVGVFLQGHFLAYEVKGETNFPRAIFEREASFFIASPSGRFVTLTTDSGNLLIIDSTKWEELPEAQASVQRAVKSWLVEKKMRQPNSSPDGPFIFPVAPFEISADDRLMTVSLGENANAFLNICMSSGSLVSSVMFDKRVNAKFKFSNSGRQFSVQVLPNSDDPAFRRRASDYGFRVFDSYSGRQTSSLAIERSDWDRYTKFGATFFLDEWVGWLGFVKDDKSVIRFDSASKQFRTQSLGSSAARGTAAEPRRQVCPSLSE